MKSLEERFFEGLNGPPKEAEATTIKEAAIEAPAEPAQKPVNQRNLFTNHEAHPFVLDLVLIRAFGLEWFTWLHDTLFQEISATFSVDLSDTNKMKILAAQTTHVIDALWDHWEIFEKSVVALNGQIPLPDLAQPLDIPTLLAGVEIINSIRKETFSEEVARYVAACFLHEDVHYAPPPLDFCQPYLSDLQYRCKDCGKVGSALPPWDGLCDSCSQRFDHEHPFSFKPDEEAVARGAGANIEVFQTYDPAPVKKRYEEMLSQSVETITVEEKSEDVQAAKLYVAREYADHRAAQCKEQLSTLRGWLEHA